MCAASESQRQRVRDDADDDLDGHERDDQAERDPEPLAVCVVLDSVRVARVIVPAHAAASRSAVRRSFAP